VTEAVQQVVLRLAEHLPEGTRVLLEEFLTVDEVQLAVEWVADAPKESATFTSC
jgi:hypothetical protein